ncbi:hypothetical protein B0T21DRAFT_349870 [Apiosordaria backusii]|uniref:Uncharacterized protein n=1 Tax=Apiosordaria backusii TaxID=314023 RepID=A0AA40B791_9PEZI|nr:hypothetical protein B0T21DRAFT_349870 [Apiosordaria backusii]
MCNLRRFSPVASSWACRTALWGSCRRAVERVAARHSKAWTPHISGGSSGPMTNMTPQRQEEKTDHDPMRQLRHKRQLRDCLELPSKAWPGQLSDGTVHGICPLVTPFFREAIRSPSSCSWAFTGLSLTIPTSFWPVACQKKRELVFWKLRARKSSLARSIST